MAGVGLPAQPPAVVSARTALVLELGAGFSARLAGERHQSNRAGASAARDEQRTRLVDRRRLRNRRRRGLHHRAAGVDRGHLALETNNSRERTTGLVVRRPPQGRA